MYNNGPKIWEATTELRWVETPHGSRLQRKWTEHLPTCVITGYGDDARPVPGCPTGVEEWRAVPAGDVKAP
jgi:hypothetical protein